jgi:hypothetical protein
VAFSLPVGTICYKRTEIGCARNKLITQKDLQTQVNVTSKSAGTCAAYRAIRQPLYLQILTHIITFHLQATITMSTQQASTGLRRSERLSKKKESAVPPSEPTKEPDDSKVQQKEPEPSESSNERDELIKEHEKLYKLRDQYRSETRKAKNDLKELLKKDIANGAAGEWLRRVLAKRHRVREAFVSYSIADTRECSLTHTKRIYKQRAARIDEVITKWVNAVEEEHVKILANVEKANNAIIDGGPWEIIKPLDLSGEPKSQEATTKTKE